MLKRAVAIAKGDVQSVGYRDEVLRIARRLGVTGQVINLRPYDVEIVAEGDEDTLRSFLDRIRIRKYPVFVDDLEVGWEQYSGDFEYFEIKRGEWQDELFERFDTAGRLLYRTVELSERSVELSEKTVELSEKSVELGERSVELSEKTVELGEKSVELSERSVELSEKTVELSEKSVELSERSVELGEKSVELSEKTLNVAGKNLGLTEHLVRVGDQMLDKQDRTNEELSGMHKDMKSYMDQRFNMIEEQILEVRGALKKAGLMG